MIYKTVIDEQINELREAQKSCVLPMEKCELAKTIIYLIEHQGEELCSGDAVQPKKLIPSHGF